MNKSIQEGAIMAIKADQELRRELLIRVLDRYPNLDAAFQAVAHMERFILGDAEPTSSDYAGGTGNTPPEEMGPSNKPRTENGNGASAKSRSSSRWCRWAPQDDAILRQCWADNSAVEEIAWKLERSPASIYGRARQLGLHREKSTSVRGSRRQDMHVGNGIGVEQEGQESPTERQGSRQTDGPQVLNGSTEDDPISIDSVVRFLRTRDYSVVRTKDGCYRLDGRDTVTAEQLFERANRVRERLGRPTWPGPLIGGSSASLFTDGPR
jgi:hypothetical protein